MTITAEQLLKQGYKIENVLIKSANLIMEDHGCLTLRMPIEGDGWGCCYGGYYIGKGYLGAEEFKGSGKGVEYIMRIMDTVGVSRFSMLAGKHMRVATKDFNSYVKIIGNIIEDKWFNPEEFS